MVLIIFAIVACEEIYRPELDQVDDFLVVEAVLVSNQMQNDIYLYKTIGFNEGTQKYPAATGALVYLIDSNNTQIQCEEIVAGTYRLNYKLNTGSIYHLFIQYDGEDYESGLQMVPEIPSMDSVYWGHATRKITTGVANSTDKIKSEAGFQIYADMKYNGGLSHYRFYARKIIQYIDHYDTIIPPDPIPFSLPIYTWRSIYPAGIFNIAGPPEYSTQKDISKHSLEFFESDYNKYIIDTVAFAGWIYIIYQYGINEDTYNFYSDLNSQLNAEGKIFDPVYVQARGNISCSSDSEKIVLGNFEITTRNEERFYLNYYKNRDTLVILKPIPFFYNIPEKGRIKDIMPDFWEGNSKVYPDE